MKNKGEERMSNKVLAPKRPRLKVYIVSVDIKDIDGDPEGIYTDIVGAFYTRKTAEKGLAAWVVKRRTDSGNEPWVNQDGFSGGYPEVGSKEYKAKKAEYLKTHKDADIIAEYFDNTYIDDFNIYSTIIPAVN